MSHAAIIEDGVVTNVILSEADYAVSIGAIPCSADVSIGWLLTDGKLVPPAVPAIDLEALKVDLKANVDLAAENERHKYITAGSGQAMTYQAKASEALLYSRVGGAIEDYPLLAGEIGITGDTLADVAATVLAMHNQWLLIGGLIEKGRLSAKAQIEGAPDEATARAVMPIWPQ